MPDRVLREFDAAGRFYDRLVGANPGYHRDLRQAARGLKPPDSGRGLRLLDAGCGTGASTAALLRAAPQAEIVGVDGSASMLSEARRKAWPPSVSFVHTPLEDLHSVHGLFDGILAAYLVRNLDDPDAGLRSLLELLHPGAPIAVHEYSLRDARARAVWTAVCWSVIIPAGTVTSGRAALWQHLWRSVLAFDGPRALAARMHAAGFAPVACQSMRGWQRGVTHTYLSHRPEETA